MGVKLTDLLESQKKVITFQNLLGKIIGIDAFNVIYQFLSSIRGADGQPLKDSHNQVTSHLNGLLHRNVALLTNGIKIVYVFDGKPNALKSKELERRKQLRNLAQHKFNDAQDDQNDTEMQKYAQGTSHLTTSMIEESKQLLGYMGIPCVQALQDGEAQASYMVQKGKLFAVGSQDYDSFLFGAERVIRNLSVSQTRQMYGKTVHNDIEFYNLQKSLEGLKITRNQLVDIAILVGVDFFEGIKGIGEKTAYKYIQYYSDLEGIIKHKSEKHDFTSLTPEFITEVRNIFLNPRVTDEYSIKFEKPQFEKISELLVEQHNFNKDRLSEKLKKWEEMYKTKSQSTLDKFR